MTRKVKAYIRRLKEAFKVFLFIKELFKDESREI